MRVHNCIGASALLLSAAVLSLAALPAGSSAVKLLVRSGKLVELTSAQLTLEVGGPGGPQRVTFAINQTAQLDHSARPGRTVNVIYARRKPMDVVVRMMVADPPAGPSNPGTGSEPLGVASIKAPDGERALSDHDAAQIMVMAQVIQPRSAPTPVTDGTGTKDVSSNLSSETSAPKKAGDDKDAATAVSSSSSGLSGWTAHGGDSQLTNVDVIRIVKSGGREKTAILQIQRASSVSFDLSLVGLETLRSAGVSEAIITAMKKRVELGNPIIK